jgi:hypothetical protein
VLVVAGVLHLILLLLEERAVQEVVVMVAVLVQILEPLVLPIQVAVVAALVIIQLAQTAVLELSS